MNKIREFRKKHELSQEDLGLLIGFKQNTVSGYETGDINMPVSSAQKIISVAKKYGENIALEDLYE